MLRLLLQVQWGAGILIKNLSRFWVKQENCSCNYPLWKACGSGAAWEGRARVNALPSHGHPAFRGCWGSAERQRSFSQMLSSQPLQDKYGLGVKGDWHKPITSAVLLSKRNFDCSCCVGTEGIPCSNAVYSCRDLKCVASLKQSQKHLKVSDFIYVRDQ